MESFVVLFLLGVGALVGFFVGANWAEWHRARFDGRRAMRGRKDHRR